MFCTTAEPATSVRCVSSNYADVFPPLADIYLEDSWVLSVLPSAQMVAFELEAVLTETHPDYAGPRPGEQYDYRRATLVVEGEHVEVELSGLVPAQDASGSTDLGNIDSWTVDEGGWSVLTGDWGTVRVQRPRVRLLLDPNNA